MTVHKETKLRIRKPAITAINEAIEKEFKMVTV